MRCHTNHDNNCLTRSRVVLVVVTMVFSLASSGTGTIFAHGLSKYPNTLSFVAGGTELEPQEGIWRMLYPYHRKSLELFDLTLADPSLECTRGVSYGPMEHQRLDVWAPSDEIKGQRIIVVNIHGGGWEWGYREYVGFCAKAMCNIKEDCQAIMVAPSYTLGKGKVKAWPRSRDDIVQVLKWITAEDNDLMQSLGGDPQRIVLVGHSAGGHLAACVGLDAELLANAGVDPFVIKALFLLSCRLGIRQVDFFRSWFWRTVGSPRARFLYNKRVRKICRPLLGSTAPASETNDGVVATTESMQRDAVDASPLAWLPERLSKSSTVPLVHISYACQKDLEMCRPHAESLAKILGTDRVEILKLPVVGHLESFFALANPTSDWHHAFRNIMSSLLRSMEGQIKWPTLDCMRGWFNRW